MKILAFDQATKKTGVAWFEDSDLKGTALIDCSKVKDTFERCRQMIMQLFQVADEQKPDVIVIEDVAYMKDPSALILLARIQGAMWAYGMTHDIPVIILKASVWRKLLGFKQGGKVGRIDLKKQAADYAKRLYDIDASEDEADAICIGAAAVITFLDNKENTEQTEEQ